MTGITRWTTRGIVIWCLAGLLAGCAGGGEDAPQTSTPGSTTTTPTPTPTTPTTTAPPPTSGTGQLKSLVIESAENFTDTFLDTCRIRVRLRNTASQTNSFRLMYTGFNAAGTGVAQTAITGTLPPNSATQTFEETWTPPTGVTIACSQIASFRLDASSFAAL